MVNLVNLKKKNEERWKNAKITRATELNSVAKRLVAAKARYQVVEKQTGVPWYFIAVTHEREASQSWKGSLAQGDPWNRVSTHVPAGRGPFKSWEEAAVDALKNCAPHAANNKDWSVGGLLTMLEQYNGMGYANKGIPSPYVWSGTDQYKSGKYVADGVFNPNTVDKQLGCAGLLMAMKSLDPSITIGKPPSVPSIPKAHVGIFATIWAALVATAGWIHQHRVAIIVSGLTVSAIVGTVYWLHHKRKQDAQNNS